MAAAGGDVIGLDWRIPLDDGLGARSARSAACRATSTRRCCSARGSAIEAAARDVLARAGGRPGHIFNLGHGVLPRTDPDVLGRLRELVHARDRRRADRRPVRRSVTDGSEDALRRGNRRPAPVDESSRSRLQSTCTISPLGSIA